MVSFSKCVLWWFQEYHCNDLIPLVKKYIIFKKVEGTRRHERLFWKHLNELETTGKTVCPSPYIRYLLYRFYERSNISILSTTVAEGGYISYENCYEYGAKTVISRIMNGYYNKNTFYCHFSWLTESPRVNSLFDLTVSRELKYQIVQEICKQNPTPFQPTRKKIKELRLITTQRGNSLTYTPLRLD